MIHLRVTSDTKRVPVRASKMTKQGQYAFVNQVHADSDNYVPFKKGDLRNQSSIALNGKQIIYHVPYAKKQYYNFGAKFTTPGTGPKWDEKALAIHRASWIRVIERAMK